MADDHQVDWLRRAAELRAERGKPNADGGVQRAPKTAPRRRSRRGTTEPIPELSRGATRLWSALSARIVVGDELVLTNARAGELIGLSLDRGRAYVRELVAAGILEQLSVGGGRHARRMVFRRQLGGVETATPSAPLGVATSATPSWLAPPPNWSTKRGLRRGTDLAERARVSQTDSYVSLADHEEAHDACRRPAAGPAPTGTGEAGKGEAAALAHDVRRVARFLRELGLYPKDARALARRHTLGGVKRLLAEVEARGGVRNPKAYLRTVLADRAPTRRAAASEQERRPGLRLVRGGGRPDG